MGPSAKISLIAPCGLNCSVCRAHLRDRNRCPGCRADDSEKPATRVICAIKTCPSLKRYCFMCREFPCDNNNKLDRRYSTKYNTSPVRNLRDIKSKGIRQFLGDEKESWTCKACGGTISMHKRACHSCGRKV